MTSSERSRRYHQKLEKNGKKRVLLIVPLEKVEEIKLVAMSYRASCGKIAPTKEQFAKLSAAIKKKRIPYAPATVTQDGHLLDIWMTFWSRERIGEFHQLYGNNTQLIDDEKGIRYMPWEATSKPNTKRDNTEKTDLSSSRSASEPGRQSKKARGKSKTASSVKRQLLSSSSFTISPMLPLSE